MGLVHGKNRTTEVWENSNIRHIESHPRILGDAPTISPELGNDSIGASRKNSDQTNSAIDRKPTGHGIAGKIIGQLINETARQLAYHETQVTELKTRLEELRQLAEDSTQEQEYEE